MATRSTIKTLRRRQLDRTFANFKALESMAPPRRGWLYEIRNALGMSGAHLAERLGVRQSTVAKLERSEHEETISLKSLRRVADAMECDLVYALVPRQPLEAILQKQALRQASHIVNRVEHTMSLEDQSRNADLSEEVDDLVSELVRTMSSEIWQMAPD